MTRGLVGTMASMAPPTSESERADAIEKAFARLTGPSDPVPKPLDAVENCALDLLEGRFSIEEFRIFGLRIVHKQRLGKGLVFLKLRAPNGTSIESIVRRNILSEPPTQCSPCIDYLPSVMLSL